MARIMIPSRRPRLPHRKALDILNSDPQMKEELDKGNVVFLFIRGYYLDSMGKFGKNDIGAYDDYGAVVSNNFYRTFNANTDPSKKGAGLAMIDTGVHQFYKGKHRSKYWAFRYYPEGHRVDCTRDGVVGRKARYINVHQGGHTNTWSAGCITIPTKAMWKEFQRLTYKLMKENGNQKVIKALLVNEEDRR